MALEEGLGLLEDVFGDGLFEWLVGNFLWGGGRGDLQCFWGNLVVGVVRFGRLGKVWDGWFGRYGGGWFGRYDGGGEFIGRVVKLVALFSRLELSDIGAFVDL